MPREVTQGSIINCCLASQYPDKHVYGIVITPRCDLAHEGKVDYVHYLPIVDFKDWYLIDGLNYLYSKWYSKKKEKFLSLCKCYSIPNSIEGVDKYEKMASCITDKNQRDNYLNVVKLYFEASSDSKEFLEYAKGNKAKDMIIENLLRDSLSAFYLIEDWEKDSHAYKIILLRELRRISFDSAVLIGKGMNCSQINKKMDELNFDDETCFIQSQVTSPLVEHIMQRFSYNFCRVGVADRNKNEITSQLMKEIEKSL